MPPWIPRLIFLIIGASLATGLLVWAVLRLRGFFLAILLSLFASFALEPAVDYFARRGMRRGLATGLVFLGSAILLVLFVGITLPPLVTEMASLVSNFPDWFSDMSVFLNVRFGLELNLSNISEGALDIQGSLLTYASSLASGVLGIGTLALHLVLQVLTIGLFTFYLLADGPRFRNLVLSVVRPDRQAEVRYIWEIAIRKTGGYVYSRGLLALISAGFTYLFLEFLGIPYSMALSVWVGVISQFVPAVGTYLAGVAPVLVALTVSPLSALITLLGIVGYQQVENFLLAPRITARTMSLHPAISFGSVLMGSSLLGPVGAIVALPGAAIIQAFLSTYIERHQVEEPSGEDENPPDD
ncbi:MAG: AI-2E family transporter [Acidimicrobiia bacterium]|nr:AI-2E family transporter [Acidimicrobiia bacterium]